MAEEKEKPQQTETKPKPGPSPLVFISHDARDAELAEAFSTLLRTTTAGMLKSFRSSDKKGTEGIEFGEEWYRSLMKKLESASDVVCLLTERSFERPWILYEAGVAKGKLNKPVLGIALGIPLSKVNTGPFYQFQNSDDTEESLTKLIMQLARRVPPCDPDPKVVQAQVKDFKDRVNEILSRLGESTEEEETPSESSTARLLEELKVIVRDMPSRLEKRLSDPRLRERRRKLRHFHPMMLEEMIHMMPNGPRNPAAILMATSLFREEVPWLEVLGREAYDAMNSRSRPRKEKAMKALHHAIELMVHSPMGREFFLESEEEYMMFRETMKHLEHILDRMFDSVGEEESAE